MPSKGIAVERLNPIGVTGEPWKHDRVVVACSGDWTVESDGIAGTVGDCHRLCNELMKLILNADQ